MKLPIKWWKIWLTICILSSVMLWGCTQDSESKAVSAIQETTPAMVELPTVSSETDRKKQEEISRDGFYTSKEEVAQYLNTYGQLPDNYITKKEAQDLNWDSKAGNLGKVAPGKSIGGSHYGNYEKQLPEKKGRKYFECDIDFEGGHRNAKRIIYSDDGLIFYTGDHYKTFEQLY